MNIKDIIAPMSDAATTEAARRLITEADRIVITTHMSPDGDAVGSTQGLCRYLRRAGKEAVIVYNDSPGDNLQFIPGFRDALIYDAQGTGRPEQKQEVIRVLAEADLIVACDYNALHRLGDLEPLVRASAARRMMLDHHLEPELEAFDLVISHPEMAAASEVVARFIADMGDEALIDHSVAEPLYCGMMTDTGGFAFNNRRPELYVVVARMMQEGVDAENLRRGMMLCPERKLRLQGYVLQHKMRILRPHRVAYFLLDKAELKRFNHQKGDSEGLVNLPLDIVGVQASAFFREEKNFIKVSLRSKGDYPVNLLCQKFFNGGGHLNAAGGEFHGSLQQAEQLFLKALPLFDRYLPKADDKIQ